MSKTERFVSAVIHDDGSLNFSSVTSPADDSVAVCYMIPDRIIPVVFIPGVMGSNLATDEGDKSQSVWLLDSTDTVKPWMTKGPLTRRKTLDPAKTKVDANGAIPSGTAQSADELRRRGWGEVAAMSYGEWLVWLENALNDAHPGTDHGRKGLRESLCRVVTPGLEPLEPAEVALSYKYQLPVHAVGYNWLQSNAVSAELVSAKIDSYTKYYRDKGFRCEKVILVSHSMGGLVARYYSEVLGQRDKVLGIVHGVMPATGAAATYKRMKTGTEGLAGLALGPTAAAMTAVVGNAPGPLQLLPSKEYGMGWLKVRDGERSVSLPQFDPYSEIYTVRGAWWGLCDDKLLNPVDPQKKTIDQDWTSFAALMQRQVQTFHVDIAGRYHSCTYAFYGDDEKHKAYGDVRWAQQAPSLLRGDSLPLKSLLGGRASDDPSTGGQLVKATSDGKTSFAQFVLGDADENGDGTVPVRSGRAPASIVKICQSFPNLDHEGGFKPEATRRFTLWAITKIARNVKGSYLEYKA